MNGRIRALLASAVALGLLAMPAAAQATTQQAPAGTALKAGAPFKMQVKGLKAKTVGEEGEKGPSIYCNHAEFTGEVISNGVKEPTDKINGSKLTGCLISTAGGAELTADVTSNAAENPWTLKFQEPAGTLTAHLLPATGNTIRFKVQAQFGGLDVGTCVYKSDPPNNPFTPFSFLGKESSNTMAAWPNGFELQSGAPGFCGVSGAIEANFEMFSGADELFVDAK
jgi:hypothetical protein